MKILATLVFPLMITVPCLGQQGATPFKVRKQKTIEILQKRAKALKALEECSVKAEDDTALAKCRKSHRKQLRSIMKEKS